MAFLAHAGILGSRFTYFTYYTHIENLILIDFFLSNVLILYVSANCKWYIHVMKSTQEACLKATETYQTESLQVFWHFQEKTHTQKQASGQIKDIPIPQTDFRHL